MSYTPTTWANGDTITAEKMNNIEQGIVDASSGGGGVLIVHDTDGTLDKTYAEIKAALAAVVVMGSGSNITLWWAVQFIEGDFGYGVSVLGQNPEGGYATVNDYIAETADGYPVLD